jgi:3-phosphoshikimate 1-carboxyvinyltransferase
VRGAEELALKESNRLETTRDALFACGAHLDATADGWRVRGVPARLRGGTVQPHGDHRIAMLGAVAGLWSENGVRVVDPGSIEVSFPGFRDLVEALLEVPA